MLAPISPHEVESRVRQFAQWNYATIFSVMKGVVATMAGLVLIKLLERHPLQAQALVTWLALAAAMVMTYEATAVGTILMFWVPNYRDFLLSFAVGLFEFILFSAIAPDSQLLNASAFYYVLAGYSITAGSLALNASFRVRSPAFQAALRPIVAAYSRRQRVHFAVAATCAIAFVLFGLSARERDHSLAGSIGTLLIFIGALVTQELDLRRMSSMLHSLGTRHTSG